MDLILIQKFLELLTGEDDPRVVFQTYHDDPSNNPRTRASILPGTLAQRMGQLSQRSANGYAIAVVINETDGRGRKKENVTKIRALFVDDDDGTIDDPASIRPMPSMIVKSSPGKKHLYWLVDDIPVEEFDWFQKALAAKFGTDPSVTDPSRVLRLPGTYNRKPGVDALVKLLAVDNPPRYKRADFVGLLGEPKVQEPQPIVEYEQAEWTEDQKIKAEQWLQARIEHMKSAQIHEQLGGRNNTLFKYALDVRWLDFDGLIPVRERLNDVAYEVDPERGTEPIDNAYAADRTRSLSYDHFRKRLTNHHFLEYDEEEFAREALRRLTGIDNYWDHIKYNFSHFWLYNMDRGTWKAYISPHMEAEVGAALSGCYVPNPKQKQRDMVPFVPLRLSAAKVTSIVKKCGQLKELIDPMFQLTVGKGHVANGQAVYTKNKKIIIEPVGPQHRLLSTIPHNPEGPAEPREFLAMLDRIFDGAVEKDQLIEFVQEWYGVTMLGYAPEYQTSLILLGERGGNGKSTFMEIMQEALFTRESSTSSSPQSWSGDYALDMLRGKFLNSVSEMPEAELMASDKIKAVISGEEVQARAPYERPYVYKPLAGHIFAANALPPVRDFSGGFWRRFALLPFVNDVRGSTKGDIKAKVLAEADQIYRWALEGARRLVRRGRFNPLVTSEDLKDNWRLATDSVAQFADEMLRESSETTPLKEIFPLYCVYAKHTLGSKYNAGRNKFAERLRSLGYTDVRRGGGAIHFKAELLDGEKDITH